MRTGYAPEALREYMAEKRFLVRQIRRWSDRIKELDSILESAK